MSLTPHLDIYFKYFRYAPFSMDIQLFRVNLNARSKSWNISAESSLSASRRSSVSSDKNTGDEFSCLQQVQVENFSVLYSHIQQVEISKIVAGLSLARVDCRRLNFYCTITEICLGVRRLALIARFDQVFYAEISMSFSWKIFVHSDWSFPCTCPHSWESQSWLRNPSIFTPAARARSKIVKFGWKWEFEKSSSRRKISPLGKFSNFLPLACTFVSSEKRKTAWVNFPHSLQVNFIELRSKKYFGVGKFPVICSTGLKGICVVKDIESEALIRWKIGQIVVVDERFAYKSDRFHAIKI